MNSFLAIRIISFSILGFSLSMLIYKSIQCKNLKKEKTLNYNCDTANKCLEFYNSSKNCKSSDIIYLSLWIIVCLLSTIIVNILISSFQRNQINYTEI